MKVFYHYFIEVEGASKLVSKYPTVEFQHQEKNYLLINVTGFFFFVSLTSTEKQRQK